MNPDNGFFVQLSEREFRQLEDVSNLFGVTPDSDGIKAIIGKISQGISIGKLVGVMKK